jgi:hypothetical protein
MISDLIAIDFLKVDWVNKPKSTMTSFDALLRGGLYDAGCNGRRSGRGERQLP